MPTKRIGIFNTGQTLFTTMKHVVGKVTALNIDNRHQENKIIIQDMFSGDVSVGVASPTVNSSVVYQITVQSGESISVDRESLEDIRTFGIVNAYGSVSGDCNLILNYHFEG